MKKLFAILLAVATLVSMATFASAANTTTLTTSVPAATYTLNIPADKEIDFCETFVNLGKLRVSNSAGFGVGKNLQVAITYTDFTCPNVSTKIPFDVYVVHQNYVNTGSISSCLVESGSTVSFTGQANGTVAEYCSNGISDNAENVYIQTNDDDWGKDLAGDYTATITFTAEVVAG